MNSGLFHSIAKIESLAAILLAITILLGLSYQTLQRELVIGAQTSDWNTSCSDDRRRGGASFTEDLSTPDAMSFSYATQDDGRHSFAIFLISPPNEETLDLDWFTDVTITASAEGKEKQQFLLYLRDRPQHFIADGDGSSSKYNEAYFELTSQAQTISLPRDCFVVPRWWITEKSVLPEDASPSFSNLEWIEISVCHPNETNSGVVVIDEIRFRGPLITPVNFYKFLFGIWSLLSLPLCVKLYTDVKKARAIRRVRLNQVAKQDSESKTDVMAIAGRGKSAADTQELERYDELSGLLSSFGIQDAIDEALTEVRNGQTQANIILVDIDDMEMLNRTKGMPEGDAMIRQIGGIIEENLPDGHKVCRWNDDKFVILCLGEARDESRILACDLKKLIAEKTSATCSFGVHQLNPINSFEEAYERAAKCVQEAKFNGKNKVVLFNLRTAANPITINYNDPLGQSPTSNLV